MNLHKDEAFLFFRLCLAIGFIEKQTVVAWADRELESSAHFDEDVAELSLSGSLAFSQTLWLLNSFVPSPRFERPLKLLFALAGRRLEQNENQTAEMIYALTLLKAEVLFPQETKNQLLALENLLEQHIQNTLSLAALTNKLSGFLAPYAVDLPSLAPLIGAY